MFSVWFVLCIFSMVLAQDPVANIPQGRIVGIKAYTEGSLTPIEIYYGVPYATAPKGRYRFSAPERHTGWRRTFYAHRIPPHCPQYGDQDKDNYSEDCLFVNIWTPRRSDEKTLPVLVILFSESWVRGGIPLPCQELASEGIVVVTVMYRLHLLAFFTLRSISARGNLALLDQYLGLLWIRDNIAAFGGDPTAITLLGHSAGADSVLHHISSPRSVGLFQRAIIMSPANIWKAIDEQKGVEGAEVERMSRQIAHSLGCHNNLDQEILRCMRERPLSDILTVFSNDTWLKVMQPVPDTFLPDSEQFLPNSLLVALSTTTQQNLQLDVMLGANDLEVLNYNDDKHDELVKRGKLYMSEYLLNNAIPDSLRLLSLDQSSTLPTLVEAIKWQYWNERPNSEENVLNLIESLGRIESSSEWGTGIALIATRLANRVRRLFAYRYSQPAGVDLRGLQYNFTGAVHGSDLVCLLGEPMMLQVARRPATTQEKRMTFLLRRHLLNFIKFGSPGEDNWKQYKMGNGHIFDIRDKESLTNQHSADRDVRFWLHYLPELSSLLKTAEKTEQLTGEKGDNRLRGGVFAMCGVAVILLLLLGVCALLLHRQRSRHFTVTDENHQ
ncbi:acetylcholinesterase [Anticarsia gemmatalis]|uniref:acetylcholinesterase n=1 Tax=Anticarsia gemmatalis TaxID=129554 RepID=UPI003F7646A2